MRDILVQTTVTSMGKASNHPLPFFPCIHEHHSHAGLCYHCLLSQSSTAFPFPNIQSYRLAGHLNDSNPQQGEMEVPCHHCPMSRLTSPSIYDRSVCVSVCLETTLSILVQNKHTRHSKTLKISLKSYVMPNLLSDEVVKYDIT